MNDHDAKPVVCVKSRSYQPNKAELAAPVKVNATPENLARAVLRPVQILEDADANPQSALVTFVYNPQNFASQFWSACLLTQRRITSSSVKTDGKSAFTPANLGLTETDAQQTRWMI